MSKYQKTTLATALLVVTAQSSAAGFQVSEHSASGLGRAFAGEAAVADNASVLARNPAAMSRFKQAELSIAGSYVEPNISIAGITDPVKSTPSRLDADDIVRSAFVPAAYFIQPINDRFAVGVGVFSTYGVATEFEKDHAAGSGAGTTDLMTFNINPSIAFKATQQLSLGLGLNATYGTATVDRYKGDLADRLGGSADDSYFEMEGDTWGFGWNAGMLFEFNDNNRIGLAYRSQVDMDFEGEFNGYTSNYITVDAGLDLPLPATAEFSGYHALTESLAIAYSILWTQWSKFEELKAFKADENAELFLKPEDFNNSLRYSIGAQYTIDQFVLRAGFAYDESAGETTLSIPESDRFWYTAGTSYTVSPALNLDFGFAYIYSSEVEFTEKAGIPGYGFKSSGSAVIASAQANYRF